MEELNTEPTPAEEPVEDVEQPQTVELSAENNAEKEKLKEEYDQEMKMLTYYDEEFRDLGNRYENYLKISNDQEAPVADRNKARLSANDCLKEKNRWQEKIDASRARLTNIEMRMGRSN